MAAQTLTGPQARSVRLEIHPTRKSPRYANPMPYAAACEMEVELAIALRAEGYAVWQG